MAELLMGIDVGTYSSKGVLVELDGTVLKSHVVEHNMDIPHPGWAEQDADIVWWADVVQICQVLLDGHPYTGEDVGGVAMSAIGPCMLPLDRSGKPLRPGILYGVDARATDEITLLNKRLGVEAIFKFSGMSLSSQAIGPKILWMKNNEPELWKQVDHITTASSYLIYRLTGEKVIDRHTASHFMPLMDIQKLEWSEKYSDAVVDIDKLPSLGWSDELGGLVSSAGARETGLKEKTPVVVGAVDALSEAISVGVVNPGDLMIMYGSTAFFILITNEPKPDPLVWTVAGAFQTQYNLAAGMATTGSLTRWFRDELAADLPSEDAYETLFAEAATGEPGSGGLLMLPYFSGERTPLNDPKARGIIAGLSLSHSRKHIFRAILEGVAYGVRHNIETFQQIGTDVKRIVAVGGGTKNGAWPQIVSDVVGISQVVPELTIGASYGDAFLAGIGTGNLSKGDIHAWVGKGVTLEPDMNKKKQYNDLYQGYLELYENTRDLIHRLVD
jgi:xylulokinase